MEYKLIPLQIDWLDKICELWNQEWGNEFPMRKELLKQNSFDDRNVLEAGSWLAVDEKEHLLGFVIAKIWQEENFVVGPKAGWIQALLVDSAHRNKGIGSALLQKAEDALKAAGKEQISFGTDPAHYFPSVPESFSTDWIQNRGYEQRITIHDFVRVYDEAVPIEKPELPGFELRLLKPEEKDDFIAFLARCFNDRWAYEAAIYFEKGGTGREFIVILDAGKIIGFCRVNDGKSPYIAQNVYWAPLFSEELGGVGPLGVDEAYRGKGLGKAVVEAGIHELRSRGIKPIVIDWTNLNEFYEKFGFTVWKTYLQHVKPLQES